MANLKEYKVLKIIKKGKKYLAYFENDETEYTLTDDQIVEFRIISGNTIEEKEFKKLKKSIKESTFYAKAIHYIDFKPRTEKEINKYLADLGVEEEAINNILKKLKRVKYIDDERYANSFVNESIRKQKGRIYINQTLSDKGIDSNYILDALKGYEKEQEIENATIRAIKIAKTITKYPIKRQKQKITERLIVDGFSYDIINMVINKIELLDESIDLLEKEYNRLLLKGFDNSKIIQKLLAKGFEYSDIKRML